MKYLIIKIYDLMQQILEIEKRICKIGDTSEDVCQFEKWKNIELLLIKMLWNKVILT